jgi:cytochrome P450
LAVATTDPVRLPPAPRIPKLLQGVAFVAVREKSIAALAKRYGSAFILRLPIFGDTVVVSDPALIKDLFTTNTDLIARAGVLGEMFGPGSTFSLDGAEHRERRKLLVPPFHGRRMAG